MKIRPTVLVMSLLSSLLFAFARGEPLKVGDAAPAVTGVTETGAKLNLGDVYKKQTYTLVYFYPKAETKGCTAQGCSLRDGYDALTKKGVAIIGVSLDTAEAQKAFKENHQFQFTLLADPEKTVVNAFGVPTRSVPTLGEIAMRQAYLIKDGKIIYTDYKGTTDKQAETILKVIDEQKG
jgi:peroxiredoxin Q/BCP